MKYSTILVGILLSGSALAVTFPVTVPYGSEQTCEQYARGGVATVYSEIKGDLAVNVLVTPEAVGGAYWMCTPLLVEPSGNEYVIASCTAMPIDITVPSLPNQNRIVRVYVDANDILHYEDEYLATELHRCPAEPATM